jgi:hypothetical protein
MSLDEDVGYATLAKWGFAAGVVMFAVGTGGELIGHALYESLPEWETVLLFDLSVIGLLVGLFSPILFGIVMPLLD